MNKLYLASTPQYFINKIYTYLKCRVVHLRFHVQINYALDYSLYALWWKTRENARLWIVFGILNQPTEVFTMFICFASCWFLSWPFSLSRYIHHILFSTPVTMVDRFRIQFLSRGERRQRQKKNNNKNQAYRWAANSSGLCSINLWWWQWHLVSKFLPLVNTSWFMNYILQNLFDLNSYRGL